MTQEKKEQPLGADAAAVDKAGATVHASELPHVVTLTKILDELPFYDYEEAAIRAAILALKEMHWMKGTKPPFKYVPLSDVEKLPDPDYGL